MLKILMTCSMTFVLFLFCGCGNGCGQSLECNSNDVEDVSMRYVSIPMCGGCFTSGWGCNSCLWGENCVVASTNEDNNRIITCNEYYYGNSCFGCGSEQESIYSGIITGESKGCYYGVTATETEYICGVFDGIACFAQNDYNEFADMADQIVVFVEFADKENN